MNALKTYITFLALALTMLACSSKPEVAETQTDANENFMAITSEQEKLAGITFGPIAEQDVEQTLSCSGIIDVPPANKISITTVYGGYITYTGVYPGDKVSKGQLLARLQDPMYIDLQRSYLEGLSKLEYLQADFERKTELQKTESVSSKQYQAAKRDLETVKIEVDALAAQLKMAGFNTAKIQRTGVQNEVEIRSPINGFVTNVKVNQGIHLASGEVLFELIDPSHVHIELNVYPNDLSKLAEGQWVYYRVAGSDVSRKGDIKLINKAVTADSRSILVHVHPEKEDEDDLLPGTFIQAEIVVSTKKGMVLPIGAVTRLENTYVAYLKVEGGVKAVFFSPEYVSQQYVDASTLPAGTYVQTGAEKLITMEDESDHGH